MMSSGNPYFGDYDYRMMNRLRTVPRWCVIPTLQRQNVAEHTFHVMVICDWLLQFHLDADPLFHLGVLRHALGHDRDEALTGDIAAGSKALPDRSAVADKTPAQIVVKVADYLEAIAFLEEEKRMGNSVYPGSIIEDAMTRMHWYWDAFPWHPMHSEKWALSRLVEKSNQLFFDPTTVHPCFDIPF